MTILQSIIRKEALHIVRDRRTMLITLIMPLALLLLFGFAISTEVNNVNIAVCVDRMSDRTREITDKLRHNEYFTFKGTIPHQDIDRMLRRGTIDAVLLLDDDYGKIIPQIIVDASNPVAGQAAASYIRGILDNPTESLMITRTLYNPQMKSAYNFVPGIMGMIFILICAIMTSVSIVREKESGTMNLLLVSPVRPHTIIFGKLIPYFALSCIILALIMLMAYTVLGLPVSATMISVLSVSLIYITLSLSIGLLVSTLVDNQVSALIVSAVIFMMPVIMLSGMIFPIDNMPAALQWLSCVIPARWYIAAMRKLMIQQLEFTYVLKETGILVAMTIFIITLAIRKFNSKI